MAIFAEVTENKCIIISEGHVLWLRVSYWLIYIKIMTMDFGCIAQSRIMTNKNGTALHMMYACVSMSRIEVGVSIMSAYSHVCPT